MCCRVRKICNRSKIASEIVMGKADEWGWVEKLAHLEQLLVKLGLRLKAIHHLTMLIFTYLYLSMCSSIVIQVVHSINLFYLKSQIFSFIILFFCRICELILIFIINKIAKIKIMAKAQMGYSLSPQTKYIMRHQDYS